MDTQRFTEEQIIGLLKEVEAGASVSDACRRHSVPHFLYYKWRAQYGGMEADELRRLREVQADNVQLTKLLGEAHLTIDVLLNRIVQLQRRLGTNDPPTPRETLKS